MNSTTLFQLFKEERDGIFKEESGERNCIVDQNSDSISMLRASPNTIPYHCASAESVVYAEVHICTVGVRSFRLGVKVWRAKKHANNISVASESSFYSNRLYFNVEGQSQHDPLPLCLC